MDDKRVRSEVNILKAYVDAVLSGDIEELSPVSVMAFVTNIEEALNDGTP
jgi:hypothetical protein